MSSYRTCLFVGSVFIAASCDSPALQLRASSSDLPANGVATREVRASGASGPIQFEIVRGRDLIEVLQRDPGRLTVRAGLKPGLVTVRGTDANDSAEITLALHADASDDDGDGFPDSAELTSLDDRALFRARFVAVARSQHRGIHPSWLEPERDCAGFVRFAYRHALRAHPPPFPQEVLHAMGPAGWGRLRIVLPDIPFLVDRPFRLRSGSFDEARSSVEEFGAFADAKHLLLYNTVALGKEEGNAESGDLLFFFHPENGDQPYHVMIYFREAGEGWLVYHTGTTPDGTGRLKEISLSRLGEHPDPSWHPRWTNENFLGYYRFKILD